MTYLRRAWPESSLAKPGPAGGEAASCGWFHILAEATDELDVDRDADQGLDSAARLVERVLDEANVCRDRVIGVGMGLPGPIDRRTGMVGASALLPGWSGIRAAEELRRRLDLDVAVDNDANLGGLAEWMWGAGQGSGLLAYIKAATGIGAGLVLGGRPYVGASGTAGELGTPPSSAAGRCAPAATARGRGRAEPGR